MQQSTVQTVVSTSDIHFGMFGQRYHSAWESVVFYFMLVGMHELANQFIIIFHHNRSVLKLESFLFHARGGIWQFRQAYRLLSLFSIGRSSIKNRVMHVRSASFSRLNPRYICPFARLPWFCSLGRRHLFPALPVQSLFLAANIVIKYIIGNTIKPGGGWKGFLNELRLVYAFKKVSCAKSSLSSSSPNVWWRKKRRTGDWYFWPKYQTPRCFEDHHLYCQRYVVELPHSLLFVVWVSLSSPLIRVRRAVFFVCGGGGISNQHLSLFHTEIETDSSQSFDTGQGNPWENSQSDT